jgi:hypothetical protein
VRKKILDAFRTGTDQQAQQRQRRGGGTPPPPAADIVGQPARTKIIVNEKQRVARDHQEVELEEAGVQLTSTPRIDYEDDDDGGSPGGGGGHTITT